MAALGAPIKTPTNQFKCWLRVGLPDLTFGLRTVGLTRAYDVAVPTLESRPRQTAGRPERTPSAVSMIHLPKVTETKDALTSQTASITYGSIREPNQGDRSSLEPVRVRRQT
jgi:hypothetical protein